MHGSIISNAFLCLVGLHVNRLHHLNIETILIVWDSLLWRIFYVEAVESALFLLNYAAQLFFRGGSIVGRDWSYPDWLLAIWLRSFELFFV